MKIAFGSWNRDQDTVQWTPDNTESGYENTAASFDGRWRNLSAEVDNEYDVVLCCMPSGHDVIKKSPRWDKLFLLQEAGFGVINTDWFFDKLLDIDADGYFIHSERLRPHFEALGKQVFRFFPPYPMVRAQSFEKKPVIKRKIALNCLRPNTFEMNVAGNIRLCQLLPEYQFVTYTFFDKELRQLVKKSNVKNWEVFPHLPWKELMIEQSECELFVSLDNRQTWGRFQLDAAALGKQCYSVYSGSHELIYPEKYEVLPTDINELARKICSNQPEEIVVSDNVLQLISHGYFNKQVKGVCYHFFR